MCWLKIFSSLLHGLTVLKNEKAKIKVTLRKYLNTLSLYSVAEFLYVKMVYNTVLYHHQFLLLPVEHRASMKSFQALRSPAIPLISFCDLPVFLIFSSIILCHVVFGLPILLYPWGFQSNAVFSVAPASLHNACPIHFHFLLFIWISIGFCSVILYSSLFVILSVHFIFIIHLKHLCINFCNLLVIWLVVFQVSQACNNTGFTFVLNIRILTHWGRGHLNCLNTRYRGF